MVGDQLRCLALFYANPRRAASAVLDHGKLLFAVLFAAAVTLAIAAAAGAMQTVEFSALMRAEHARLLQGAIGHEEFLQMQSETARLLSHRYFAIGLKSLLILPVVFVPFCILLLAAWDRLGGALTILFRDYSPVLAGLLFAWSAAHVPVAILWWSPLMPNAALVVPLQAAGLILFVILAAPVLSTVTGAYLSHAAVTATLGLAVAALAAKLFTNSGNLLYLFASPWLLYLAYQRFGGDIQALGGGLSERQNFKRQLEQATINPHDADAHYQLGLLYAGRRLPAEAEQSFRRSLAIDPKEPETLFALGRLLRHQEGRDTEARELLEQAAQINPKLCSYEVWRELGALELGTGNLDLALRYLTHYATAREYDPEGLVFYGQALRSAGRNAEAKSAFERAIEAVHGAPGFRRRDLSRWESQARQELRSLSSST
jgi:tetratricopeptide (TPR) repeat protein